MIMLNEKVKTVPPSQAKWGLVLLFVMMSMLNAFAQKETEKAFLLKSGEVVYGALVDSDSLGYVFVENSCGIRMLKADEIEKVSEHRKAGFLEYKKRGYYNISSLALLFGEGKNDMVPVPSLTIVNGYYFTPQLFTGVGIGYEYYDWSVMPVFLEVKYLINQRKFIPFVSLKIGMGISMEKNRNAEDYYYDTDSKTYNGAMISPELGMLFPTGKNDAFLLSVGYHHQQLSYDSYPFCYQDITKKRIYTNFNRISLRVSYMFR